MPNLYITTIDFIRKIITLFMLYTISLHVSVVGLTERFCEILGEFFFSIRGLILLYIVSFKFGLILICDGTYYVKKFPRFCMDFLALLLELTT